MSAERFLFIDRYWDMWATCNATDAADWGDVTWAGGGGTWPAVGNCVDPAAVSNSCKDITYNI